MRRTNLSTAALRFATIPVFLSILVSADAATITWTNTAGGNWNSAANWSPNQVPSASDTAIVTNTGTYTVTLDIDVTVASLTLGGASGTQTLVNPSYNFTLTGASVVETNGALGLNGGLLAGGGLLTLDGHFNWTGGRLGTNVTLTVATNGVLVGAGGNLDFSGILTNAGTIQLTSGVFRCIAYSAYGGGYGLLVNSPGGTIDFQADVPLAYFDDKSGAGTPALINQGLVRKSAGSGTSSLNAPLYNSGTLDVQSGIVAVNGGGNGSGEFKAEAGATLAYPVDYEVDGVTTGPGTNLLNGGVLALKGSIAGQFVWVSGRLGTNTIGTVATNGVLVGAGGNLDFSGILTNAGTIRLTSGVFRCIVLSSYGGGYGLLVNSPNGIIDFQADVPLDTYTDNSGVGTPTVINQGTVRKSAGSGLSSINPLLFSFGTIDVPTGSLSLHGGGNGNGVFRAEAGATLDFSGDYRVDSSLTGAGTNTFSGGTVVLNGILATSYAVLSAGVLTGTNGFVADQLTWTGGRIGAGSTLTLAANGVLVGAGGNLDFSGILTNAGTIQLTSGVFRCIAYSAYGGGYGLLVNSPGGTIDFQADVPLAYFDDKSGAGTPALINQGLVRKSAGSGTSSLNAPLYNSGTLDVQSGTVAVNGGGNGSGEFKAEAGATLAYPVDYEVDGVTTGPGTNLLNGAVLALKGSIAGQFVWVSGRLGTNTIGTVATNGVLVGAGGNLDFSGILTNAGTIRLTSGVFRCIAYSAYGGGYGLLINSTSGLIDFQADVTLDSYNDNTGVGAPAVINQGTVRKSAGTGTSIVKPAFFNTGILDAQSGILSLNGGYDLTGGTLNFGISSLGNFGQINLSGAAALTGTLRASLNGGYIPVGGNSFAVLNYGSESGLFTNTNLPVADAWSVNYGAAVLTLNVLNARPTIGSFTNQIVNELATLTLTNFATDADVPAQTLTFSFASAPNGMNLTPQSTNAAVIGWTPAQTNSPSTNTISVVVTDSGSPPLSATNTFLVMVREVNVAPTLSNIATQTVNELNLLTVNNTATETNIHATTTGYGLLSAPPGMTITNGIISWTPAQTNSPGTNLVTTVVTNNDPYDLIHPVLTATNTFTVLVREVNVAPTLPNIATQTVNELSLLLVTNSASEFNIHATTTGYGLINPLTGMSVSTNGIFSWTPSQNQSPGTNLVTIVATNNDSFDLVNPHLIATNAFTVLVREVNFAPTLPIIAAKSVNALALLTVTNTATETNIHATLSYLLVNSPPTGASIDTNGVITWTPTRLQGPSTNTVTTVVTSTDPFDQTNPHLSATNSFQVIVFAPTLAPINNAVVNPGQTVSFNAAATDNDRTRTLTFSLLSGPGSIGLNNGAFSWRPPVSSASSSNFVQVQVKDNSAPPLTDTKGFTIVVNSLASVELTPIQYTNGHFVIQISGSVGPDYILQAASALTNNPVWVNVQTNAPSASPFSVTDTDAGAFTYRYYRVELGP